jgi:hypothetical protein
MLKIILAMLVGVLSVVLYFGVTSGLGYYVGLLIDNEDWLDFSDCLFIGFVTEMCLVACWVIGRIIIGSF